MQKKHKKWNIPFSVTAILLVLMIMTVYFMPNGIYAKYKSTISGTGNAPTAKFLPQFEITGGNVGLNYSNVNSELNRPKDVHFSVSNYENNEVSDVDINYSLIFYIPMETFAETAMFQIMDTQSGEAVTPLYSAKSLLEGETHTTDKNTYNDYPSGVENETLTVSSKDEKTTVYSLTKTGGQDVGTIKVEQVKMKSEYYLLFGFWTEDGNTLLDPTIKVNLIKDVPYLKITVSRSEFVLKGGEKDFDELSFRLLPSSGMTDTNNEIDLEFHESWDNAKEEVEKRLTGEENIGNYLKIIDTPTGEKWTFEYITTKDEDGKVVDESLNVTQEKNGESTTYNNVQIGHERVLADNTTQRVSCGKSYPCRLNVLFEQASPTESGS